MRITKGFTLIEIVVVLVAIGIIAASSSVVLKNGFQSYFSGVNISGLNTQAALVMTRMTEELQQVVSFTTINATNVTFLTMNGSNITYSWTTPTLTRKVGASAALTMNDKVTAIVLSYYNSAFNVTATPNLVRAVNISLTLSNGAESVNLVNTVYLPNMSG